MSTNTKITYAIHKCEEELKGGNRYPTIPVIIESLKRMLHELNHPELNFEQRARMVGGLGKIVTDNFDLLKSDVGKAIVDATNEFLK